MRTRLGELPLSPFGVEGRNEEREGRPKERVCVVVVHGCGCDEGDGRRGCLMVDCNELIVRTGEDWRGQDRPRTLVLGII